MILTPLLSGQLIAPEVIQGIANQTIAMPWLIHTEPARIKGVDREVNINANRQQLQQLAKGMNGKYVILMDSDVIMHDPNTIAKMLDALQHSDAQCLAVDTKGGHYDHVITALAIMRKDIYECVRFWATPSICQCKIIANMCKVEYIQGLKASEKM